MLARGRPAGNACYIVAMKLKAVRPARALPGGVVELDLEGFVTPREVRVEVGAAAADLISVSPGRLLVRVPEGAGDGVRVTSGSTRASASLRVGVEYAAELHPVGNPTVDSFGNVYVTFSGSRGETVPFGVFVVGPDGVKQPFLAEIVNPTGLAVGPDQCLYITSRHTGNVYRSTPDKQVERYAEGLGLATGLVFDSKGNLFVGDRGGTIYRITPERQIAVLCELEPSVSAYHLAVNGSDDLLVTGPTLATQDSIYRVTQDGKVETYFRGLGRPQGLAFNAQGELQVVASYRGRKGVYTFREGRPELTVAGPMLVGLAYDPSFSYLYLVDSVRLYRIPAD